MLMINRNVFSGLFRIKLRKAHLHREIFYLLRYESLHIMKKQAFDILEYKRAQFPRMPIEKRTPQLKSKLK